WPEEHGELADPAVRTQPHVVDRLDVLTADPGAGDEHGHVLAAHLVGVAQIAETVEDHGHHRAYLLTAGESQPGGERRAQDRIRRERVDGRVEIPRLHRSAERQYDLAGFHGWHA